MTKNKDETKPNRRMVERLLREMSRERACADYDEYQALSDKAYEREREVCEADGELRRLQKASQAAYARYCNKRASRNKKLQKVRQTYLADGITPKVLRMLNELVADLNGVKE